MEVEESAGPSSEEPSLPLPEPHRESADKQTQFSYRRPPHRSVGRYLASTDTVFIDSVPSVRKSWSHVGYFTKYVTVVAITERDKWLLPNVCDNDKKDRYTSSQGAAVLVDLLSAGAQHWWASKYECESLIVTVILIPFFPLSFYHKTTISLVGTSVFGPCK